MYIVPFLIAYASNEPKSVLARDLGDCRDNLRNSRSVFLIVGKENKEPMGQNLSFRKNNRRKKKKWSLEENIRPRLSHSNSLGNNAEKDTAGCRALTRKCIVIGGKQ